jgi:hypothetical protein
MATVEIGNGITKVERVLVLGSFTDAQRDALTGVPGMIIYNSQRDEVQAFIDNGWLKLDTAAVGE